MRVGHRSRTPIPQADVPGNKGKELGVEISYRTGKNSVESKNITVNVIDFGNGSAGQNADPKETDLM